MWTESENWKAEKQRKILQKIVKCQKSRENTMAANFLAARAAEIFNLSAEANKKPLRGLP